MAPSGAMCPNTPITRATTTINCERWSRTAMPWSSSGTDTGLATELLCRETGAQRAKLRHYPIDQLSVLEPLVRRRRGLRVWRKGERCRQARLECAVECDLRQLAYASDAGGRTGNEIGVVDHGPA